MNALEALEKLDRLNSEITALNTACSKLWDDIDTRIHANRLDEIMRRIEAERDELEDRLSAVKI